jgi:glycerate dehydrogenase
MATIEDILSKSDFISLNCSLNNSNKEMVNSTFLNAMKPSAFLINTARGGLINENHLANALKQQIIAGAALDVMQAEPPLKDHPLFALDNCIITPHNAWAYPSSRKNLMEIVLNNLKAYLEGKPVNLV